MSLANIEGHSYQHTYVSCQSWLHRQLMVHAGEGAMGMVCGQL